MASAATPSGAFYVWPTECVAGNVVVDNPMSTAFNGSPAPHLCVRSGSTVTIKMPDIGFMHWLRPTVSPSRTAHLTDYRLDEQQRATFLIRTQSAGDATVTSTTSYEEGQGAPTWSWVLRLRVVSDN
jgi:hypothetical protein